jgi:hypothetical protein
MKLSFCERDSGVMLETFSWSSYTTSAIDMILRIPAAFQRGREDERE